LLARRREDKRLYGIEVDEDDCIILIDLLLRVGRADDHSAAAVIDRGLSAGSIMIPLSPVERDAILNFLDDPPESLVELRGALARDHRDRLDH
jgi:hypothetical protein